MKYSIGDMLIDEDGYQGLVCVKWNDGDLSSFENDAAHPNPKVVKSQELIQDELPFTSGRSGKVDYG